MAAVVERRKRRRPGDGRALTAGALVMPIKSRSALRKVIPKVFDWQRECLDYFDTTPELKYTGWWVGNAMSKVKLYAAVEGVDGEAVAIDSFTLDENGEKVYAAPDVPDAVRDQAVAELARLRSESGSQGELLRESAMNVDHAGECWLVGWGPRDAVVDLRNPENDRPATSEYWEIRSIDEVEFSGTNVFVIGEPGDKDKRKLDTDRDTIIRIWQRHPRWSKLSDSHVRGTITQLRTLQLLEGQIQAESMSRHNAGILLVKKGITWASASQADPEGQKDDEDPFVAGLTEGITAPVADPGDPSSVVPNVALVDDIKDAMAHIPIGRDTGASLDARIDKRIDRLAGGLNVPKEVVLGHRSTTFSNADQISDDEFTDHLEPRVLMQCDALTFGFLRPQMIEAGGESAAWADRVFIWYDASALLDPPDQVEAANAAFRNFAIGFKPYRAALGFSEDDAPSVDEQLQMLGLMRGILTAELTQSLIQRIDPTFQGSTVEGAGTGDEQTADGEAQMAQLVAAVGGPNMAAMMLMQVLGIQQQPPPIALSAGGRPPGHPR